jgi:hypothetical protein
LDGYPPGPPPAGDLRHSNTPATPAIERALWEERKLFHGPSLGSLTLTVRKGQWLFLIGIKILRIVRVDN